MMLEVVLVRGFDLLGRQPTQQAVLSAFHAQDSHGHALFIPRGQEAAFLIELQMFLVLIHDPCVFCHEFTGLVFFVMFYISVYTLHLGLFDQHPGPWHAHDSVVADLVSGCFGLGRESVTTLPCIS